MSKLADYREASISMNGTWLDRNRNIVFGLLSFLALVGVGIFYLRQPAQNPIEIVPVEASATPLPTPTSLPTPTTAPVRVYITGAIENSDVYFLPQGSIIKDVIEAAGGFTPDADLERINQALELKDQQQIHIPRLGEEDPPPAVQGGQDSLDSNENVIDAAPTTNSLINLNTATLEQLDTLPGIGPVLGQRIIEYRESVDGFTAIEEITQVSGIGDATFTKIKDLITVE